MTDTLDRINTVLAGWDATPVADADWLPGDPLYDPPRGDGYGEQTVRPMFQLIDEAVWLFARCEPCGVSWAGIGPCWVCGVPPPRERPPTMAELNVAAETIRRNR